MICGVYHQASQGRTRSAEPITGSGRTRCLGPPLAESRKRGMDAWFRNCEATSSPAEREYIAFFGVAKFELQCQRGNDHEVVSFDFDNGVGDLGCSGLVCRERRYSIRSAA